MKGMKLFELLKVPWNTGFGLSLFQEDHRNHTGIKPELNPTQKVTFWKFRADYYIGAGVTWFLITFSCNYQLWHKFQEADNVNLGLVGYLQPFLQKSPV